MNIQHGSASVAPNRAADAMTGKSKGRAHGEAEAADAGGFLSLLTTFAADEGAVDPGDAASSDFMQGKGDAAPSGQTTDAGTLAQQAQAPGLVPTWLTPAQFLQARTPTDATPVVAKDLPVGGVGLAVPAATVSASQVPQESPPAPLTGPAHGPADKQADRLADGNTSPSSWRAAQEPMLGQEADTAERSTVLRAVAESKAVASQEALRAAALDAAAARGAGPQSEAKAASDLRMREGVSTSSLETVATPPVAAQLSLSAGAGGRANGQTERQTEREKGKVGEVAVGGSWGMSALQGGSQADATATAAGSSVATPEFQVAEQVKYWVANDVKNAELKLDNFGQSPVEVSISLQGNEARVEFRTDMAEMRQVLEGAVVHLRDMLQSEGLVLAGMSVGASGAEGSGAREQSSRQSARQATVAVPEVVGTGGRARGLMPATGRAVDLFV